MKKSTLTLFAILALALFFSFFNHKGIALSDEYMYSFNAWSIANGTFELSPSAFSNRFGMLLPMASFIKQLGASYQVLSLWSLIAFLVLLLGNYYFVRLYDSKTALLSTLFLALNPALLQLSADVSQDLVMGSFSTLAILILWRTQSQANSASFSRAFAFSGCLFWAFITKLTVVFLGPIILYFLVNDLRRRSNLKFWLTAVIFGAALLAVYFLSYHYFTGNVFYRFEGIEGEHNIGQYSYYGQPFSEILKRITVLPIAFLLKSWGLGVFVLLSMLWVFKFDFKKLKELPHFMFFYLLTLLVTHWFGSTSLKSYNPLIFAERMWLLIIPPASILSVFVLEYLLADLVKTHKRKLFIYFLGTGFLCFAGLLISKGEYIGLLLPLAISILLLRSRFHKGSGLLSLPLLVLWPFLLLQIFILSNFQKNTSFFDQKTFLENLSPSQNHLLLSDQRLTEMYPIYFEFHTPENIQFKRWNSISSIHPAQYDRYFVLFDKKRKTLLEDNPDLAPNWVFDKAIGATHLDNNFLTIRELSRQEIEQIRKRHE